MEHKFKDIKDLFVKHHQIKIVLFNDNEASYHVVGEGEKQFMPKDGDELYVDNITVGVFGGLGGCVEVALYEKIGE